MRKSKFTEEQVAFALRQVEAGTPVPDIARKLGISKVTFYRWKKRFLGPQDGPRGHRPIASPLPDGVG